MKNAKLLVLALVLLVVGDAGAFFSTPLEKRTEKAATGEGFFRPTFLAAGIFACALQYRYNAATPKVGELTYIGGGPCISTYEAAADRAVATASASTVFMAEVVPGEPAIPPVYECSATINFNPLTASQQVELAYTGGPSCSPSASRLLALRATRQGVLCQFYPVPCNLPQ